MKVLVTGASSGIGRSMAKLLLSEGHEVIAVGRDAARLGEMERLGCKTIALDLSNEENCRALFEKAGDCDCLINNAGFGDLGLFAETDLEKELGMIHTNVICLHILTKLYLQRMTEKKAGYILNVGSVAGFFPGPYMATYYATKAYVLSFSRALAREQRIAKSGVYVGCLCPGPVDTRFSGAAGAKFAIKGANCDKIAAYALKRMWRRKQIMVPTFPIKCLHLISKLAPARVSAAVVATMQNKKLED